VISVYLFSPGVNSFYPMYIQVYVETNVIDKP